MTNTTLNKIVLRTRNSIVRDLLLSASLAVAAATAYAGLPFTL